MLHCWRLFQFTWPANLSLPQAGSFARSPFKYNPENEQHLYSQGTQQVMLMASLQPEIHLLVHDRYAVRSLLLVRMDLRTDVWELCERILKVTTPRGKYTITFYTEIDMRNAVQFMADTRAAILRMFVKLNDGVFSDRHLSISGPQPVCKPEPKNTWLRLAVNLQNSTEAGYDADGSLLPGSKRQRIN